MKKIIIECLVASQKTAILENDKLTELLIEDNIKSKTASNIYRGIVKKVLPGMQACFVDIGFEKLAYLQLKKDNGIKSGQDVLVQVNKEEIGTKGAKLNLEISIAGRYLVYIPSNNKTTVSSKISKEEEKDRLKEIVKSASPNNLGFIIRTEAVGCSKEELEKDIIDLKNKYENILKEYKLGIGPKLLYKELDLSSKYVKDNINENVEKIVTNSCEKYEEIKNILKYINKDYVNKLVLEDKKDIFNLYRIDGQIDKALSKKVWLKSGGYLIIEKTEALTVIDVNTGKFTGNLKLSETVYKTNLEASIEIAKQLKLRDIGGIIIIDFIDMHKDIYKEDVIKYLNRELKKDKRKTEVLGMTKLGLVEVTRRREKDSIDKYYIDTEYKDYGARKSINYIIDSIENEVLRISQHTSYENIKIELNGNVYNVINEKFTNIIKNIGEKYGIIISLGKNSELNYEKINIIYNT
ncbi:Rne/Rng family ribonuclease [Clostridium sp. CCUG 7971]|uniref:Rne/Rng family ribonuclease n=1 Tax=Clostridium sp. CCUG 7971 TaxID=2811414 RepID=UPI001ABB12D9|nr:Rne/Rng family ribonuclease [Clostridium sp. CCUG 7971]MBO3445664.1 Rne/Rng family ribonuclease [Clostridium sp. CCUG 7971]